jgi:hypothetical protein
MTAIAGERPSSRPFLSERAMYRRGMTFGGHPVQRAGARRAALTTQRMKAKRR